MNVSIIGTGYVGLVTGTCLAEMGNNVLCIDVNATKVKQMQGGELPIYEPQLDVIFERNIKADRLKFSTNLDKGLRHGDVIFLALPTPEGGDGSADLSFVLGVAKEIGKKIQSYKVIVDKSTVPVGTADRVFEVISKETNVNFDVVSNPEFLREGFAVNDFLKPERIIIGSSSKRATKLMEKLYKPFVRSGNPIIKMDERSAELTKYAANSFLATKITFMNEIANFCEKVGADVDMVRKGMGTDSRIGKRFLFPGIGYGGSCFPKDVKALHKSGLDVSYNFNILDAVIKVNDVQKTILIPRIQSFFKNAIKDKTFGIWGLAFKPETDDIREAPSLYLIENLLKKGAIIKAFDPEAISNVKEKFGNKITYTSNQYEAADGVDALIICTEWSIFRTPDFNKLRKIMKAAVIFDGRNLFDIEEMKNEKFHYSSIGRETVVN